ncbi:MAG: hypothetical protein ACQEWV_11215 [Bacillota bacterium]
MGARTMEQFEKNLGTPGWSLPSEDIKRLDEASKLFVSYPYNQDAQEQRSRGRV